MRDLSLQFFGRLFALEPTERRSNSGQVYWWCHCECGEFVEVISSSLISGHTLSCGCLQVQASTKHGDNKHKSSTPYGSWAGMLRRCRSPIDAKHKYYFDKGIKVCAEWQEYASFKEWALKHGWSKGLTIDRIDSNGDYCPENCQWVTLEENGRRSTRKDL